MKLQFNKLETTNDTIQVSWDGGNTWNSFPVSSAKENGITFSEIDCPNISLIKVKGKFTTVSNLDFVAIAKEDTSSVDVYGISLIDENGVFGFHGNVVISNDATSIDNYAFYGCSKLTSVVIPDSVTSISKSAFYNCSSLTSVTIPSNVTSIGDFTFQACTSLKNVVISKGVSSIGRSTFSDCIELTSIVIPETITSIGVGAFSYCSKLKTINFTGSMDQWFAIPNVSKLFSSTIVINYNYKPE